MQVALGLALLPVAFACECLPDPQAPPTDDRLRELGATRFLSANPSAPVGPCIPELGECEGQPGLGAELIHDVGVEGGETYLALEGGLFANLNRFRGVQILDLNDPDAPLLLGDTGTLGTPVALYPTGSRVVALTHRWRPLVDRERSPSVEEQWRGALSVVETADPAAPTIVGEINLTGRILACGLVNTVDGTVLYVISSTWAGTNAIGWNYTAVLESFRAVEGTLLPADRLELPGAVSAVRAVGTTLLVGSNTGVTLVEVSGATGNLLERGAAATTGYVPLPQSMDLQEGVLRVASTRVTSDSYDYVVTNHLQTFDTSDLDELTLLDEVEFGAGDDLHAALFLGHQAFFSTWYTDLHADPLHVFEIGDDGAITARAELLLEGFVDTLEPVLGGTRVVGMGQGASPQRKAAVMLFDSTDPTNQNPLLAGAELELDWGSSALIEEPHAASILEDALSLPSGDGTATETGLVLLPIRARRENPNASVVGVQLFTFSSSTITQRGFLPAGAPVTRTLPLAVGSAAALSEAQLATFSTEGAAPPSPSGRLVLADNIVDWLPLPDGYSARVLENADYQVVGPVGEAELPPGAVEVLAPGADLDRGEPVARFEIPATAVVFAGGAALVVVQPLPSPESDPPVRLSRVFVYDVRVPDAPALTSVIDTDRLPAARNWYWSRALCWECAGLPYALSPDVLSVPGALVFVNRSRGSELLGDAEVCEYRPDPPGQCATIEGQELCTTFGGELDCRQVVGDEEPTCTGFFTSCDLAVNPEDCVPVGLEDLSTFRQCTPGMALRDWERVTLELLDLRDPANAALAAPVELTEAGLGGAAVADGSTLWVSFANTEDVPGDLKPYRRWFAQPVDLADPQAPVVGATINVPGELLFVDGNGALARDWLFGPASIDGGLAWVDLDLSGAEARLRSFARQTFRDVQQVHFAGEGRVLTLSRAVPWYAPGPATVSVFDDALAERASFELPPWTLLRGGAAGRALLELPGSMLVVDLDEPEAPRAQALLPLRDWPASVRVLDDDLVVPAGRFGIQRFGRQEEVLPGAPPAP